MKTIRIIMLACSLAALMMADQAVMGEEAKIKTTAELIAEVEGTAEPATATPTVDNKTVKTTAELIAEVEAEAKAKKTPGATLEAAGGSAAVDENAPKSAAEILAEIAELSTPSKTASSALDQEQVASTTHTASATQQSADSHIASGTEEELPLDSDPLPDEVIGEYAIDDSESASGTEFIVVTEVADATDTIALKDSENAVASDTESLPEEAVGEARFEKADALEPHLLLTGTPSDEEAEAQVSEKLSGRIIAENHPLSRRRHMYRWVLKTADGLRIPLKSNIKLLQEVRRDEILDSAVSVTGRFIQSGFNDNLRYFVVETVVVLDAENTDKKPARTDGKKPANADKKAAAGTNE